MRGTKREFPGSQQPEYPGEDDFISRAPWLAPALCYPGEGPYATGRSCSVPAPLSCVRAEGRAIPHSSSFPGEEKGSCSLPFESSPSSGGDAGGAACPSAYCGHTSCVASGRRQPHFPGVPLPKSFDQGRARSRAHVSCNPSFPAYPLLCGKGKFIRAPVRGAPHRQAGLGTEQYFGSCAIARIRSAARAPQDLFQKSFVLGLP